MWTPEDRAVVGAFGCGQALSDDQYRLLVPLIPPPKPGGRPRTTDMRRMLDGLFYVVRTGCQWRHLPPPPAFPPWRTVYGYFRDFIEVGVWESMRHHLLTMVREQSGRDPSPSVAIIDTQSVKTTEKQPCLFDVGQKLVWGMRVVARRAAENAAGGASTLLTRVQHRARDRQGRASRAAARCPMGILDRPCARRLSEARSGRRDGLADRTKGWARTEPSCRRPALCVIEPEAQAGSSFQV
jgi:transposase